MKKIFFLNITIAIALIAGSLNAQNIEKDILSWMEKHSRQELRNRIHIISSKFPNSPVPLFLAAYTEENADRAFELYKQIIEQYPNSQFTDEALLRIAQYYYAIGSYINARQYASNLATEFPESAYVPEAKFLAARCLIATGYYISAEDELKAIARKHSESPFKLYAKEELTSLHELSRKNNQQNLRGSDGYQSQPFSLTKNSEQRNKGQVKKGKYTIQIGAFRDKNNAITQQEIYSQKGYLATIETKIVNSNLLYLVWVGEFDTEDQAARFGEVFKKLHGISFHVVRQ